MQGGFPHFIVRSYAACPPKFFHYFLTFVEYRLSSKKCKSWFNSKAGSTSIPFRELFFKRKTFKEQVETHHNRFLQGTIADVCRQYQNTWFAERVTAKTPWNKFHCLCISSKQKWSAKMEKITKGTIILHWFLHIVRIELHLKGVGHLN